MKDYNLSRESFHELLDRLSKPAVEFLLRKIKFCTTDDLVNLNTEFFEPGSFRIRRLKWKEWLAFAMASWFVEDECLQVELRYQLGEVYLGDYEFLKVILKSKNHMINYLWESNFRTSLIFNLLGQIFANAKHKISLYPPRDLRKIPKPNPVRRIGVGYKDQGSARISSKKTFLPEDSRKIQHLLHVERLKRQKETSDLISFIRGFGALDGEFI